MARIRGLRLDDTARLLGEALPRLTQAAQNVAQTAQIYVTARKRGQANLLTRRISIPAWVFASSITFCGRQKIAGGVDFAAYYLAHELAHLEANTTTHNTQFMAAFKRLCPPELHWYEAIYKPRLAAAAGIAIQQDSQGANDSK